MRFRTALFTALVLTLPVTGIACRDAEIASPGDSLVAARARWAATAPATYTMTVHLSCECSNGPVVIRVKKGVVESRRYVSSGELVEDRYVTLYPSVDELFDFIQTRLQTNPTTIRVEYDAVNGYPTLVETPGIAQMDVYTVSVLSG